MPGRDLRIKPPDFLPARRVQGIGGTPGAGKVHDTIDH